jgi:hypothetical protein
MRVCVEKLVDSTDMQHTRFTHTHTHTRTQQQEYLVQLVDVMLAREQRKVPEQLREDTPHCPDVHRRPVRARAKQQLGGAVPSQIHRYINIYIHTQVRHL